MLLKLIRLVFQYSNNENYYFGESRELIQTEAERRRREAGVKQSMEIRLRSCMYVGRYVCGWVWYLELALEPRHVAQQVRYQYVGIRNGHCLGTISSWCYF